MLNELMKHMEWADASMWDAILKSGEKDERLHKLAYHIHMTQYAFLDVWQRKMTLELVPEGEMPTYQSVREWARRYYGQARELVARSTDSATKQLLQMPWADTYAKKFGRRADPATFEETVLQVASHTTHHRGQVNMRLRELGFEPPLVDYVVWVWIGKPDPVWDRPAA